MKKLNFKKLTPELERTAKRFAKSQIKKYLSTNTSPGLEREAERSIKKFYKLANLDLPEKIIWVDSAFDKGYLAAVDSVVYRAVDSAVHRAVYRAVDSAVYSVVDSLYWANRFSWFKFYSKYMKPNDMDPMVRFTEIALGGTIVGDTLYLFRKHDLICRDTQGRLHSENSMAFRFRDGNGFYFYHGVQVSEKAIMHPEKLTKRDWLNESNAEVRRVIQERMVDFPKKIGAKVIDKSKKGQLLEVELEGDPEKIARYAKVKDSSTARVYFLRVPPDITKVDEAIAWTFGLDKESYQPNKEA